MQQMMRTVGAVVIVIIGLVCGSIARATAAAQGLEPRVTALESEVEDLQATVNEQASQIAALEQPLSKSVIFAFNRPIPFDSDPVDTSGGWQKMTITVGISSGGFLCGYALQIPANGAWIEQLRVNCDCGAVCPVVSIPVISDTARFSTGTASGNITAAGLLEK